MNVSNYFLFYQLPVGFEMDLQALRAAYFEKSKSTHPDYFTQSSAEEQENALQLSVINNLAYQTLRDAEKRAAHLLQVLGIEIANLPLPADFLMQMMELNEQLDELKSDFSPTLLAQLQNTAQTELQQTQKDMQPLVDAYLLDNTDDNLRKQLQISAQKLRFLFQLQKNIQALSAENG